MSHRVTVQTEIKDKALAIQALKASNIAFREQGDVLHLTSGGYENVSLNLKSGEVSGDTDYGHKAGKLGLLRQNYAEAKYKAEAFKQGVTISGREELKNGDIVLQCSMA